MSGQLRLKAEDADDLTVIASCLQDAVVPVSEMTFLPDDKQFILVATRFRWENAEENPVEGQLYERVHCGVRFDGVTAARLRDIDRKRRADMLSLLTIEPADGRIDLIFAAGGVIRLEVERILCHLEDLDEPWPTQWKPAHPEAESA